MILFSILKGMGAGHQMLIFLALIIIAFRKKNVTFFHVLILCFQKIILILITIINFIFRAFSENDSNT